MLSHQDNELLCRVGPGTPMGELFRQYWLPAMLSSELPGGDCDQIRVKLLGEELIGFRDSDGRVGLVHNACPHRGASLFYARNEDCGLRCVYHGWKFDVEGNCVDMPNEPAESNFNTKVRATAYPCVERGGIVWAYLGRRQTPPALPDLEGNMVPDATVYAETRNCNWMQALEGDIDTVHMSWLHAGHLDPGDAEGAFLRYQVLDRHPKYSVLDTEWGTSYAAFISASENKYYCRMAHFLFPCYTMVPQGAILANRWTRAWVPMDDDHVIWFAMSAPPLIDLDLNATRPGKSLAGRGRGGGMGAQPLQRGHEVHPSSSDWYGRFRPVADASNDYLLDRDEWKRGESYTGLPSITIEDHMATETMGTIYDRTQEHLGTSDAMIIRTRQRLIRAAQALKKEGVVPPGVDEPSVYRKRSGGLLLPKNVEWFEATAEARRAFVNNPPEEILASIAHGLALHPVPPTPSG